MAFRTFLASRNIEFSLRRYGIDALNFMALGLFSSLIIGLILKTVGGWLDWPWLIEIGKQAQGAMGAAIGVGVAYALKAPPLVLFASVATGTAGAALGGPVGCFIAAAVGAEFGKLVYKSTPVDIVATPAATLIRRPDETGAANAGKHEKSASETCRDRSRRRSRQRLSTTLCSKT